MKIIFLNIWRGKLEHPLESFLKESVATTDGFCFQEAPPESLSAFKKYLSSYQEIYVSNFIDINRDFDQATLVKTGLEIGKTEYIGKGDGKPGLGLHTEIMVNESPRSKADEVSSARSLFLEPRWSSGFKNKIPIQILNFHGTALPLEKLDTPERIEQSQNLIDHFKNLSGPKIIGGDFNLELKTRSVEIFEENGYRNLIKEFNIKTTRNRFSWDAHPPPKYYYSDYLFVSKEVNVRNLTVPSVEVSDHEPMILEIEV